MWQYPSFFLFKSAISENKKINLSNVITFKQEENTIIFTTSRPSPTTITFKTEKECNEVYWYLVSRFCQEIEVGINEDLPF